VAEWGIFTQQAYTARFNKRRVSDKRRGFSSIIRINAGVVYLGIYGMCIFIPCVIHSKILLFSCSQEREGRLVLVGVSQMCVPTFSRQTAQPYTQYTT